MGYNTDENVADCLRLMKNDVCEAIVSDELLYMLESHVNNWDDHPKILEPGLQFIAETIAFRMALAISRLFESARKDRANFEQLKKLCAGLPLETLADGLESALNLGQREDVVRIKDCRNRFMAHSLRGSSGNRDGMQSSMLSNVLQDAEQVFEEVHQALKGDSADLGAYREKWKLHSSEFWRNRLPQNATAQPEDLESRNQLGADGESSKSILNGAEDLTNFSEWQKFLGRLEPLEVGAAWSEAYRHSLPPFFMLSFHSAVIDRLMEIAHLSVRATDEQRAKTVDFVEKLIAVVHKQFASDPEALVGFDAAIANARKFYESFGTPTTREFLFDRGLRDAWGAEPQDPHDKK